MISGYHQEVANHYEKFPYPHYPPFAAGKWSALDSVDCELWGASHPIRDIWITGAGTIAPLMFARRNFRSRILASDLSKASLEICARRLRLFGMRNVALKCEDLLEARYENEFDAVDAFGVLHHTVSPQKSLENIVKALRPGGVVRLMVYSEKARAEIEELRKEVRTRNLKNVDQVQTLLTDRKIECKGDLSNAIGVADALLNPMVHVFNPESFDQLLQNSGLEILKKDLANNFLAYGRKI